MTASLYSSIIILKIFTMVRFQSLKTDSHTSLTRSVAGCFSYLWTLDMRMVLPVSRQNGLKSSCNLALMTSFLSNITTRSTPHEKRATKVKLLNNQRRTGSHSLTSTRSQWDSKIMSTALRGRRESREAKSIKMALSISVMVAGAH